MPTVRPLSDLSPGRQAMIRGLPLDGVHRQNAVADSYISTIRASDRSQSFARLRDKLLISDGQRSKAGFTDAIALIALLGIGIAAVCVAGMTFVEGFSELITLSPLRIARALVGMP